MTFSFVTRGNDSSDGFFGAYGLHETCEENFPPGMSQMDVDFKTEIHSVSRFV
jgi:hypothetical protein